MRSAIWLLPTVAVILGSTPGVASRCQGHDEPTDVIHHVPIDWTLLRFSDDVIIQRVHLVMEDFKGSSKNRFNPRGQRVDITDAAVLTKFKSILPENPLRMATPDDGRSGGGWGTPCFGRLDIETNKGEFFISISEVGFHLNDKHTNMRSVFWSGRLARIIDDNYFAKFKKRITFEGLTLAEQHARMALTMGGFEGVLSDKTLLQKDHGR